MSVHHRQTVRSLDKARLLRPAHRLIHARSTASCLRCHSTAHQNLLKRNLLLVRPASTVASSSLEPASPPTSHASTTSHQHRASNVNNLTWNDFFKLRQSRRYWNLASSFCTAGAGLFSGLTYASAQPLENLQIFGLDPFLGGGILVVSSLGVGWLLGPLLGSGLFRVLNRKRLAEMSAVRTSDPLLSTSKL